MLGMTLQDWVTIRGGSSLGTAPVIQGQPFWLDLLAYRDVIAWLDVRSFTNDGGGGSGNVQLTYQTSPTQDESLFASMAGPFSVTTGVTITQMIAPLSSGAPLARYLRWSIAPSPAATTAWDITFRILVAVNNPGSARSAVAALSANKRYNPAKSSGQKLDVPIRYSPGQQSGGLGVPTLYSNQSGQPRVNTGTDYKFSKDAL